MTELKCPFCQQKLVYDSGIEQWCCDKCHLSGGYNLWQAQIDTRKALDIAINVLNRVKDVKYEEYIDEKLEQINELTKGRKDDV